MPRTTVTVKLDRAALRDVANGAASEISRTLAFEVMDASTEHIQEMGAIDTGYMRDTGYVETGEGGRRDGPERGTADVTWTPEGPGEAKAAYSADYTEIVHEGYGSNARYGPRPFLKMASDDVAARAQEIAQDIVDRMYGS